VKFCVKFSARSFYEEAEPSFLSPSTKCYCGATSLGVPQCTHGYVVELDWHLGQFRSSSGAGMAENLGRRWRAWGSQTLPCREPCTTRGAADAAPSAGAPDPAPSAAASKDAGKAGSALPEYMKKRILMFEALKKEQEEHLVAKGGAPIR